MKDELLFYPGYKKKKCSLVEGFEWCSEEIICYLSVPDSINHQAQARLKNH
jgi:hypothetical protein